MSSLRESRLAWVIVLAVVGVQLFALRHEPRITRVDLNDNVFHLTLAERMVEALEEGENPLDCWVAEWSFGYPVARTYQPLGHLFLVLLYRCLGKTVSLLTLFVWIRLLLICFFPVSLFLSARFLGLRPRAAAAAALLSPLVATNGLYGIEYGSYLWRGGGLYTQAWAMHLMALAVGVSFRAVQCGRGLVLAGALAGLTFLAHFIYGLHGRSFHRAADRILCVPYSTRCSAAACRFHRSFRFCFDGVSNPAAPGRRFHYQSQPLGVRLEMGLVRWAGGSEASDDRQASGLRTFTRTDVFGATGWTRLSPPRSPVQARAR